MRITQTAFWSPSFQLPETATRAQHRNFGWPCALALRRTLLTSSTRLSYLQPASDMLLSTWITLVSRPDYANLTRLRLSDCETRMRGGREGGVEG